MMKLIILGPPGSGKGTVAERLEQDFSFFHISARELLRKEAITNTLQGKKIKALIDAGQFKTKVGQMLVVIAMADDKAFMASRKQFSFSQAFAELRQAKSIFSSRFLRALLAFSIIIGIVQAAGNSYYGIFIYELHFCYDNSPPSYLFFNSIANSFTCFFVLSNEYELSII